jgi:UDP-2,3-diacylglucosamine pyrophosphatase LpxH
MMRDRGEILFARSYTISNRLIITHGNELDKAKPLIQLFIRPFKYIQVMRIRAGLKPVNVARLAKRVEPFYRLYRWKLMRDAVRFARKNGFETITCGHAHHPEDRVIQGVRYINTGAWTDYPVFYLLVNEKEIRLQRYAEEE